MPTSATQLRDLDSYRECLERIQHSNSMQDLTELKDAIQNSEDHLNILNGVLSPLAWQR